MDVSYLSSMQLSIGPGLDCVDLQHNMERHYLGNLGNVFPVLYINVKFSRFIIERRVGIRNCVYILHVYTTPHKKS
jgi:hypothetical protein